MPKGRALGFIESVGLASSIAAADAALKAANVELIGRENPKGSGMITIKLSGEVGAIKAAISAAKAAAENVAKVWSVDIIPRPGEGLGNIMGWNSETVGADEYFNNNADLFPGRQSGETPSCCAVEIDEEPEAKEEDATDVAETPAEIIPSETLGELQSPSDIKIKEDAIKRAKRIKETTEQPRPSKGKGGKQAGRGRKKK